MSNLKNIFYSKFSLIFDLLNVCLKSFRKEVCYIRKYLFIIKIRFMQVISIKYIDNFCSTFNLSVVIKCMFKDFLIINLLC